MKTKCTLIVAILCILSTTSCRQMFNGMVSPNQCQRCELFNTFNNDVLWTEEGCGSENTRLEEKCQIKGWELSRNNSLCDLDIRCERWKKEKDEE